VTRNVGNGAYALFWTNKRLRDILMCDRFRRLFDLSEDKWVSMAAISALGWENRARFGSGNVVCWRGRRSWLGRARFFFLMCICKLALMINECGSWTGTMFTLSTVLTFFSLARKRNVLPQFQI